MDRPGPEAADDLPSGRRAQLVLDLGHVTSLAESDFLVGENNRLAFDHIRAFPVWPGPLTLIAGPAKSGKSHLARIWAARANAHVAGAHEIEELARRGGGQPVIVEDVDRAGYEEGALFHLLNQSMRDRRPLLLTARVSVGEWPYKTNDLLSRARLAAHFAVDAPNDIQLSQMFVKLFADRQVTVDPKVITYLVARMERSHEEAVILVAMMDKMALSRGSPITRKVAAEALALRAEALEEAERGDTELEDWADEH